MERAAGDTTHPGSDQGAYVLAVAAMLAGPLAAGIALGLRGRIHDRPGRLALAALGGLALSVASWPVVRAHGHQALVAAFSPQSAANGGLKVALGHVVWCWLALAGCGPALAWLGAWLAPPTLRELEARSQRRTERRVARLAQREQPDLASAVGLGARIAGDAVLPSRGRELVLPLAWLARHALVLGASGSGKTETLLRIAHEVARRADWAVFLIDGKGDRETMRRFHALMADAGRRARLFPDEGYDGWRGSASDVASRLVEVIDFAQEGPGAYYRDQAVNLIRLACDAPAGPPRNAHELLARLDLPTLATAYAGSPQLPEVLAYTPRQVAEVRARYSGFFGAIRGRLDQGWAFEDTNAGYLLLDGLRLKHEATRLARFLVEDFTQYAVERKPPRTAGAVDRGRVLRVLSDVLCEVGVTDAALGAGKAIHDQTEDQVQRGESSRSADGRECL